MTWDLLLAPWRPVTLDELDESAELLTRTDRKYIVSETTLAAALATVRPGAVLEVEGLREQAYSSTYYDTPGLDAYKAAAHRRPRRYKVRTRSYLDSDRHAIELKMRSQRGTTVKHREWVASVDGHLGEDARRFLAEFPDVANAVAELGPVLTTTYRRTTLVMPHGRVTIDAEVTALAGDRVVSFAPQLIVETKSSHHAGDMDRAFWALGARPARVSKYCTSLAALSPELPSNRWARTVRRHLNPSDAATVAA